MSHLPNTMTRHFLFILLLTGQVAFGQFADSISKITFRYDKGHYTFGSSERYSTSEIVEYSKSNDTEFKITSHIQLKKSYDSATSSISVDTIKRRFSKTSIANGRIEKLFNELNISRDNFSSDYVKPFLTVPTRKVILNVASKYDLRWMFKNESSDKAERNKLFKSIQTFSLLDTFLLMKKPNPEYHLVVTDVWNGLSITCLSGADTIEYRSQYFELFGQPVKKYVNKKYSDSKKTINLEINNSIKGIVPKNSLISQAVDLNELKDEYISWFIKTKF